MVKLKNINQNISNIEKSLAFLNKADSSTDPNSNEEEMDVISLSCFRMKANESKTM